jgi:hypothetical protein
VLWKLNICLAKYIPIINAKVFIIHLHVLEKVITLSPYLCIRDSWLVFATTITLPPCEIIVVIRLVFEKIFYGTVAFFPTMAR